MGTKVAAKKTKAGPIYRKLMKELKKEDTKAFRNFLRLDYETFHEILQRIEGRITKTPNNYRTHLSAGIKLAITHRFISYIFISYN